MDARMEAESFLTLLTWKVQHCTSPEEEWTTNLRHRFLRDALDGSDFMELERQVQLARSHLGLG